MKLGKVSETIVNRSIVKEINTVRNDVIIGAAVGEDCAILQLQKEDCVALTTNTMTYQTKGLGTLLIHNIANNIVASGAIPAAVEVGMLLPVRAREAQIKQIMSEIDAACQELGMQVAGGSTEVTDAVVRPVVTATGIGTCERNHVLATKNVGIGEDIVMSKWAALQGSSLLAKDGEHLLKERFAMRLIETTKSFSHYASIVPEAMIAKQHGVSTMHDVSRGGIFQALWELVREAQIGFEVDLRKIRLKQETIEVCEYFQINPYALDGTGALLMVTKDGAGLVTSLEKAGIEATIIGRTQAGNDKIILNEDQRRCLEVTKEDEYYKAVAQIREVSERERETDCLS